MLRKKLTFNSYFPKNLLLIPASLLLWLWIIWLIKPVLQQTPGTDAGIFAAVAQELLKGRILYVEVFESKPPMIFLLNALSLSTRLGYHAIRITELLILSAVGLHLLTALYQWFGKLYPALLAAVFFFGLALSSDLYSKGNQTELFSVLCLASGMMLSLSQKDLTKGWSLYLAGMLFAMSILFREFFAPAALLLLAYVFFVNRPYQKKLLISGFISPFAIMAIWFSVHHIWPGYLDYLQYQISYKSYAGDSFNGSTSPMWFSLRMYRELLCDGNWFGFGFLIILWLTCFLPGPNRQLKYLPLCLGVMQGVQLLILSRSGYHFGHYYQLAVVPIWGSLLLVLHILNRTDRLRQSTGLIALSLIILWMVKPHRPLTDVFKGGLKGHPTDRISSHLKTEAKSTDLLYVDIASAGYYYADNRMHSALKIPLPVYHYFSLPMFGNSPERNAEHQFLQMKNNPPSYIIRDTSFSLFLHRAQAIQWIESHYRPIVQEGNGHVLLEYRKN